MSAPKLTELPGIPDHLKTCSKCKRHQDEPGMGWISRDYGCAVCSPENERHPSQETGERPS